MKCTKLLISSIVLSVGCILTIDANAKVTGNSNQAKTTVIDSKFQSDLRSILSSQDLNNFNANLDNFSVPYTLKNGDVYYEANKQNLDAGSAVIVNPNGYYYIAYKTPNSHEIVYITNDKNCSAEPHDAIKVFAHRFATNPIIINHKSLVDKLPSHSCNSIYGNQKLKKNIATRSIITLASSSETEAQQKTRQSAESIWGSSVTNNWEMNDDVADVVGQAVNEIRTCSANFSLVPKPPAYGTIPGLSYFAQYGLQVIRYNSGLQGNSAYKACIVSAAVNFRSAAEMASLGI